MKTISTKDNKIIPKTSSKTLENHPKWPGFWWGNGVEFEV